MAKRVLNQLTPKFVERALKGLGPDGRHTDGGNLYLLVRGSACSWIFLSAGRGKQKQFAIGSAHKLADMSGQADPAKRALYSLTEARIIAAKMRENLVRGLPIAGETKQKAIEWQHIKDYYLKVKKVDVKKIQKYCTAFEEIISQYNVDGFTRDMAIETRDKLLKDISPNTVKTYIKMLSAIFELYINDNQSNIKNPFAKLTVEAKEAEIDRRDPMPIDVIQSVRKLMSGDDLLIFDLLTLTGARIGEIVGIKSSDIQGGYIRIEGNEKRAIKNTSSKRVIPAPIALPERDAEYYFADDVGVVTWRFAQKIRQVTTNTKITTHSLRHSLTNVIRDAGIDHVLENFLLGHATNSVAAKSYGSFDARAGAVMKNVMPAVKAYADKIGIETVL